MTETEQLLQKVAAHLSTLTNGQHPVLDEVRNYLAKPKVEPEPIGYMRDDGDGWWEFSSPDDEGAFPVYRESPARKPLSEKELHELMDSEFDSEGYVVNTRMFFKLGFRAAEKAHGIT